MSALAHVAAGDPNAASEPPHTRRSKLAWLLLLPGLLWLLVFFVAPLWQLFTVSLQSDYPGYPGYYYNDVNVMNYVDAVWEYRVPFLRAFLYAAISTFFAFVAGLPAGLRDGVQGRPLAGPDADLRHRPVLHLVHPADLRLAADPGRRGLAAGRAQRDARCCRRHADSTTRSSR